MHFGVVDRIRASALTTADRRPPSWNRITDSTHAPPVGNGIGEPHSCNGCNYPRKKLFNGTNYGSYRTQICLVSCSISTCFIKGKTSYGRHYHKFCSWRATISTILNNATAQYFPVATHAADTKQFKFNITCSNESQYTCFIVGYGRR